MQSLRAFSLSRQGGSWLGIALLVLAVCLGGYLRAQGLEFYLSAITRVLIYGIAACSLNLVLGYAGLVSFGHAAFWGLGAYVTGILIQGGQTSGYEAFVLSMFCCALLAALIGFISLRTKGVYFIMITLAFSQMLFYLMNSNKSYGGDEGFNLTHRLDFGFGFDLKNPFNFYLLVLLCLTLTLWVISRLVDSRFGRVIRAQKDDELRAAAIGFNVFAFQLCVFMISGALTGLAGALMANQQNYVSPALLNWTESGLLMMMVIFGGVGTVWGGLLGALVILGLEEFLADYSEHFQFYVGWILLLVVLFLPRGLISLFDKQRWSFKKNSILGGSHGQ
jgi:branched-chain amino acid transport system permease protein